MTTLKTAAASDLKSYLERIEAIAAERQEMADEMRAVFAEAKAAGFDTKAIRAMAKRRAKDPAELAEQESLLDTYMHAVGMTVEPPLYAAVRALGVDTLARDQVIASLQLLIPVNGEIIARVGGDPLRLWRDETGQAHAEPYVEAKPAPEKTGRALKKSATVLSIVPTDPVKTAADAAEARSKSKPPTDEKAPSPTPEEEPVE